MALDERGAAYLEAARQRVVIFDGAMGTSLQLADLSAEDYGGPSLEGCSEAVVLSRPDVVKAIHRSFLDVGVDVVEANAFGGFSIVLAEYGLEDRVEEINLTAARLAREAADEAAAAAGDGRTRWVAGNLGPGTKFPTLGQIPYLELRDAYQEQATALITGGVDLLLVETVYDLLQAKAAINAAKRAMVAVGRRVPIQVQVTIELTGRMLPGTEIGAALTALDPMRPDIIGLNCATGPAEMGEAIRYLSQHARMPVSAQPNAGLPSVVDGKMHYDLTPEGLADHLERFITELRGERRGRLLRHHPRPPPGRRGALPRPRKYPRAPAGLVHRARAGGVVDLQQRLASTRTPRSWWWASAPTPTGRRSSARPCWPPTGTPPWPSDAIR